MADTDNKKGLGMQEKLIGLLVLALVVASGGMGYLYGKLTALTGLGAAKTQEVAGAGQQPSLPAEEPAEPLSDELWAEIQQDPAAVKGSDEAQVVIVEFTDYECPFCGRHFEQTDGLINENYVDTGKVKYITRDLPLPFHANAHLAAQAARCAGDQGKYWEMHDELFGNQDDWAQGDTEETLSSYAAKLALNVSQFDQCVSSEKYKEAVDADLALAQKVGANGTPTFYINGKVLVGAQPYEAFETVIEQEL